MDTRVPVTILTGFLGSGKTTLLNHILSATHGKKIAIIENEFGETSIDDKLLATNSKFDSDEEIVEVLNGCICCSVRKDLVVIVQKLAARCAAGELKLDGIVIETTGMADPAPVAQTFLVCRPRLLERQQASISIGCSCPVCWCCRGGGRSTTTSRRLRSLTASSRWWTPSTSSATSTR